LKRSPIWPGRIQNQETLTDNSLGTDTGRPDPQKVEVIGYGLSRNATGVGYGVPIGLELGVGDGVRLESGDGVGLGLGSGIGVGVGLGVGIGEGVELTLGEALELGSVWEVTCEKGVESGLGGCVGDGAGESEGVERFFASESYMKFRWSPCFPRQQHCNR
jgi:hypothetical protein